MRASKRALLPCVGLIATCAITYHRWSVSPMIGDGDDVTETVTLPIP